MTLAPNNMDPCGRRCTYRAAPGPVPPVPIPHPYVGMLIDPFDYVPIVGSTVLINGMHRGQAERKASVCHRTFPSWECL